MPPRSSTSTSTKTSTSSLLAPGVALKLAVASVSLAAVPAVAWSAARSGKLDALLRIPALLGFPASAATNNVDAQRLVLAGAVAVAAVNLVLALYVVSAFSENVSNNGGGGGGGEEIEEEKDVAAAREERKKTK